MSDRKELGEGVVKNKNPTLRMWGITGSGTFLDLPFPIAIIAVWLFEGYGKEACGKVGMNGDGKKVWSSDESQAKGSTFLFFLSISRICESERTCVSPFYGDVSSLYSEVRIQILRRGDRMYDPSSIPNRDGGHGDSEDGGDSWWW